MIIECHQSDLGSAVKLWQYFTQCRRAITIPQSTADDIISGD